MQPNSTIPEHRRPDAPLASPPRRLTILTDFDGVWTRLEGQAAAVREARVTRVAELARWPASRVRACFDRVEEAIRADPAAHGWRSHGRITAYADEDPFLMHNALVSGLETLAQAGDGTCTDLVRKLAERGWTDLTALGSEIFLSASQAFLARAGHDLVPHAVPLLHNLLEQADVVFCTNFTADLVAQTWKHHGIAFGNDPHLRLRGNARKQFLSDGPPDLRRFGERTVAVDRPFYREALLAERPDIVVGDVFSLDLALPLALRESVHDLSHLRACLCRTPWTPHWALEPAGARSIAGLHLLDTLQDLLPLVASFTGDTQPNS